MQEKKGSEEIPDGAVRLELGGIMVADNFERLLTSIRVNAFLQEGGSVGARKADDMGLYIESVVGQYAEIMALEPFTILSLMEQHRVKAGVDTMAYYKRSRFPDVADLTYFESVAAMRRAFSTTGYLCPACKSTSSHATVCTKCDFDIGVVKSFGMKLLVKEAFLTTGNVVNIFPPVNAVRPGKRNAA